MVNLCQQFDLFNLVTIDRGRIIYDSGAENIEIMKK